MNGKTVLFFVFCTCLKKKKKIQRKHVNFNNRLNNIQIQITHE